MAYEAYVSRISGAEVMVHWPISRLRTCMPSRWIGPFASSRRLATPPREPCAKSWPGERCQQLVAAIGIKRP